MSEQARHELKVIVDRLGPNMWLHLDEVALIRYFGPSSGALEAATAFARQEDCIFIPKPETRSGRFGRAYYKRGQ